jgi:hypothetical protein
VTAPQVWTLAAGLDSSAVQAWSAAAIAVLTGVLIWFTRKYVKKTGEIVTAQRDAHKIQERYLETMDPKARDTLRRALIQHEADRDAISPHRICKLYGSPQLFASTVQ